MARHRDQDRPLLRGWAYGALAAAVLLTAACSHVVGPPRPRNAIVILVDTLRADHLGLYGYDRATDPTLARFAESAAVFTRARSQAGCTFPSVNSILTSRHPVQFLNRIDTYGMAIPGDTPSIAVILGRHGWATAAVSASVIVRATPSTINRQGGFGRGFDRFDEECLERGGRAPCVNDQAFKLLDELPEPLFLYLHYMDPHAPYRPAPWHPRRFARGRPDRGWVRMGDPERIYRKLYEGEPEIRFDDADRAWFTDLYDEEIAFFDSQLAELLARLEAKGLLDRTAVVLLSDHGEELLDHGEWGHCRDIAYESLLATPLVMRIPGVTPGRYVTPVRNLDLVPTLLDYLGVEYDRNDFDGTSLRPVLEGTEDPDHPDFTFDVAAQGVTRAVIEGGWKLALDLDSESTRLYDLVTDPGETVDLSEREPDRRDRMRRLLEGWRRLREGPGGTSEAVRHAREHEAELRALGYL